MDAWFSSRRRETRGWLRPPVIHVTKRPAAVINRQNPLPCIFWWRADRVAVTPYARLVQNVLWEGDQKQECLLVASSAACAPRGLAAPPDWVTQASISRSAESGWQRQHPKDCAVNLEMLRLDLLSWGAPAGNLGSCASMWNVPG